MLPVIVIQLVHRKYIWLQYDSNLAALTQATLMC